MNDELGSMMSENTPTKVCEDLLRRLRSYNEERSIDSLDNEIIGRILDRTTELAHVYNELYEKLSEKGRDRFFDLLVDIAAGWNLEYLNQADKAKKRHCELREEISRLGLQLAELLRERDKLNDFSGFAANTTYHFVDLFDQACTESYNSHYQSRLQPALQALREQYSLKYWPRIDSVIDQIALDAFASEVYATDAVTAAGTESSKRSKANFVRALNCAYDEELAWGPKLLPIEFRLSDAALAALVNVCLDLSENEMVCAQYIKRLRQRDRARKS